ncbi:lactonase family protein [Fimbriiglobus ruber]|uniref:6-phosphogluconolactonase n=1 Tax=Fimbriiglobus ruber TaxID=1908690 RepID=A0A225DPI3_9BACT|nr:lactonase family protein [Fimbriiglobus ruber]OWK38077.1 6-phosphogluconolactonase [Fimbriiglobus ruber]
MIRLVARGLVAGLAVVALAGAAAAADPAPAAGKFWVFVGTYTGGPGKSKGIYRSEFDAKTGQLSAPEVAAEVESPSFVNIAPNGKNLYAIGETGGKDGGGVYAFTLDPATGKLTAQNALTSGGPGPCHIATDAAGEFAVVANYGGGSTAIFKLKPDGSLAARTAFVQHKKTAEGRQEAPHAHCGTFDNTGKFVLVCDLGLDKVLVYKLNRETGEIAPNEPPAIAVPLGAGPRHIQLTPANDLAFVCGELDSTVNVLKLDFAGGHFATTQSLSTLPGGKPVKGNSTAEIRIHPSGKFVYVSNRGHNSIAVFKNDGGTLTPVGHATEGIKVPRNFNIDPTGRWMLVANQDGHDVVVFEIDQESGLPKPTGTKIAVGSPVCVKFVAKP